MSIQNELQTQFRQQQEKYVYYIVALSVTAIGFSVYKTTGQPLKLSQIPLAIAVLAWGISVYCGLTFIRYVISNLYANFTYFDVIEGKHPQAGTNAQLIKAAAEGISEAMKSNSNVAADYSKWQNRLFYFGVISFIVWHIIEMYLTK